MAENGRWNPGQPCRQVADPTDCVRGPEADQYDLDFRLGYLVHDVSRLRRIVFDRALAPLKITRSQWRVLEFIAYNGNGLPQTQLAHELDIGKVAVGSLIDRLERTGFVVRRACANDRRVNLIFLTAQAHALLENIRIKVEDFDASVFGEVEKFELRAALRTLLAMKRALLAL